MKAFKFGLVDEGQSILRANKKKPSIHSGCVVHNMLAAGSTPRAGMKETGCRGPTQTK